MFMRNKKWLIGLVAGALILAYGIMAYGNPQWNRWIYIFQAYYLQKNLLHVDCFFGPGKDLQFINQPLDENFTGEACIWYKSGALASRAFHIKGKRFGIWEYFDESGRKFSESYYWNDRRMKTEPPEELFVEIDD